MDYTITTQIHTHTHTHTHTHRETDRQTDRQTDRERERERVCVLIRIHVLDRLTCHDRAQAVHVDKGALTVLAPCDGKLPGTLLIMGSIRLDS